MFDWPGQDGDAIASRFRIGAGAEVECATWGRRPADAPTIMLLHEGLGCIRLWRDFPARLSKVTGCGVLAYSRLGYGASSPVSPPLPITRMADEAVHVLPRLIQAVAPRQLVLVGHSDGGTIVAHYLAEPNDTALKGAVLMAPHFFCEPSNVAAIKATSEAYRSGDLRHRLAKYHDDVEGAFYGWADTWLDPKFSEWDMRPGIAHWRHPVLFVQGVDDPYGSQGQADAAALSEQARIEWLANCAHSPHLEQTEETLRLIRAFVAEALDAS